MIKGIIIDVDGVIVGEKIGYNSPNPNSDVSSALKSIREKGIIVSLCTAKPHYSVQKIINDAKLHNLHITNGGGVIIDTIDNVVLKKHLINEADATSLIRELISADVFTEFYSVEEYYLQKSQKSDLSDTHTFILQREPQFVESVVEESKRRAIVKIMPVANDEKDKERIIKIFEPFKDKLSLSWGIHPIALPHVFGIITAKGISKQQACKEIMSYSHISQEEMLGIGDSTSDWQFMELCGYVGAMGNASEELKKKVEERGVNGFVGKSVDENGILDILRHFNVV